MRSNQVASSCDRVMIPGVIQEDGVEKIRAIRTKS